MRMAIPLLLLMFSMSAQTDIQTRRQTTGAATAEDFTHLHDSDELKELRDMVVELRVMLKYTQDELKVLEGGHAVMKERLVASESKVEAMDRVLHDTKAEMKTEVDKLEGVLQDTKAEMKNTVDNLKKENAEQEAELAILKTRLTASEADVITLKQEIAEQSVDLRSVAAKVADVESDMEQLKKDIKAQHTDLTTVKTDVMNLTEEHEATATEVEGLKKDGAIHKQELVVLNTRIAACETGIGDVKVKTAALEAELKTVKTRLANTETGMENLEKEIKGIKAEPKVAFSAGLTNSGYIESGSTDMNLVFSRVITNVGQAYSNMNGFFTAPIKGVYYFRFTVMDSLSSRAMRIWLYKNGQLVMWLSDYDTDGNHTYLSSGLALQLEKGDKVNLRIPASHRLFDNLNNHSTFSGFLIFPL